MIYDPFRRVLELRQRILESMSAEELEEYAREVPPSGNAGPHHHLPKTSPITSPLNVPDQPKRRRK